MGARHKHKNVDTTDSVIQTYSWIIFIDVPLFYFICRHVHINITSRSSWSNRVESLCHGLTCLLYCNSNQCMHVCNNWTHSAWNGECEIRVSCSSVFEHTTLSYMRHINTRHEDSILLDKKFVTRHFTVAQLLIFFKNMLG
jgi:hypothetical protein